MPNASTAAARSSRRGPTARPTAPTGSSLAHDARRLAQALERLGVQAGDRVATLAMNHDRHLDRLVRRGRHGRRAPHLNPRLFDDQLEYIVNHAEDRVLLYDAAFAPLVERMKPRLADGRALHLLRRRVRRAGWRPRTAITAGTRATSATRAACATPAARPAIPRACSTSIARPCSTRCRSSRPTSSTCRRAR